MFVALGLRPLGRDRAALRCRWPHILSALVMAALTSEQPARACDLCAVYTGTEVQQGRTGFRIGVAEQFTRFGTLRDSDKKVANPGERMNSSITQFLLGYNFSETLGLQLNVPIVSRRFTRLGDEGLEKGDETGFGDTTLIGLYSPIRWVDTGIFRLTLMGGLKLPTGRTGRLREELAEAEGEEEVPDFPDVPGRGLPGFGPDAANNGLTPAPIVRQTTIGKHETGAESGIHGHDLALGSGSVDGLVGMRFFANWKRLYATGMVQYFLRTQGRFNYQFANELLWRVGPGMFLALDDTGLGRGYTLGISAQFSGETKGLDKLSGRKLIDTGYTGLYLGPSLNFTWGESLQASLSGQLPVEQNNSALQIVPDYRIQGALTWRF